MIAQQPPLNRITASLIGLILLLNSPLAAEEPAAPNNAQSAEKPKVRVTISEATTGVIQPLRPDGYPDYFAALNQLMSTDVTSETNAAVLFWKAAGPASIDAPLRDQFWKLLGIDPLPETGEYFLSLADFVKARPDGLRNLATLFDQTTVVTQRPWKKEEFPVIAAWLEANKAPLALVVEGTKRPHRYEPLVPETERSLLLSALLSGAQLSGDLARCLVTRAMLHAGNQNFSGAKDDLLACHRLANLVGESGVLVDGLVSISIHEMVFHVERSLMESETLTASQLAELRNELLAGVKIPNFARCVDVFERWILYDCVCRAAASEDLIAPMLLAQLPGSSLPRDNRRQLAARTEYDIVLKDGAEWYDRLVSILKDTDPVRRHKRHAEFNDQVRELSNQFTGDAWSGLLVASNKEVSEFVGSAHVLTLVRGLKHLPGKRDLCQLNHEITDLGFALAQYKLAEGRFPERLEQLVPKYIKAVPRDVFGDGAVRYASDGRGYRLYSVGNNGVDDGGRDYDDAEREMAADPTQVVKWDDVVLCVPAGWKLDEAGSGGE